MKEEPTEVRVEAEYRDETPPGSEGAAYWERRAIEHAIHRLLGRGSLRRPMGAPDRIPGPSEQLVITVDDGVVTARIVPRRVGL